MADGMTMDAGEIKALARDIDGAARRLTPETRKIVSKGALNIKNGMRRDMQASPSFSGVARSINYDLTDKVAVQEAEIGPSAEPGSPGNLANIAYFGGARGGGTVYLTGPLEREAESFFEHVERLAAESILG